MSKMYKEAGVNLEAGYESVKAIKSHVDKTKILGTLGEIGAFGGLFDLSKYDVKEPILVSGTDGVGTKLMIAMECDILDTIGIDAVAMCVNDVLVQGAIPLFFLDYLAVGKNRPKDIERLVKGVSEGCIDAECALIGGETAEMPDLYEDGHFDIAGFSVGVVDKSNLITKENIKAGDKLIGLPSSGCHSNGFSLIRKVLLKDAKLDLNEHMDMFEKTLGEELLTPTRIYVKAVKPLLGKDLNITGMSHITGGGFFENLPRILKDGQGVVIDKNSFPHPPIFDFIGKLGAIPEEEMYNVFNMGIGFVIAVDQNSVEEVLEILSKNGDEAYVIGEVTDSGKVELR